jgi:hypothetical protein
LEDIAYRVIAANERPDHSTIARFVARHQRALAGVFSSVLAVCAKAGLVKTGVLAVDGTKVAASVNRDQTLDFEQIAREALAEAKAIDAAEDELYGDRRGDELPPELATSESRKAWLRKAMRELAEAQAANEDEVSDEAGQGGGASVRARPALESSARAARSIIAATHNLVSRWPAGSTRGWPHS